MSINYINDHKSTNGIQTTTITYCIDTGDTIEANQIVKSRGGDLTVPNGGSPRSSSSSSFKRLFQSSFNKHKPASDSSKTVSIADGGRRHSSEFLHINSTGDHQKISRTRSLKVPSHSNKNNNTLSAKEPIQRSASAHGPHGHHSNNHNIQKTPSSPPTSTQYLKVTEDFLHRASSTSSTENNTDEKMNTGGSNRQSFIKRLSMKLRKSSKKSMKKQEQDQVQKKPQTERVQLNLEVMKQVFNFFDYQHKGYITTDDVDVAIKKLECLKDEIEFPTKDKINESFYRYSKNPSHTLGFEEFLTIMRQVESEKQAENDDSEMRYMFNQFDRNKDGKITRDELKSVMTRLFPDDTINDHDVDRMLDEADLDQNGSIDYNEFVNLFQLFSSQIVVEKSITRELVTRSIQNCGLIINMSNKKMQTIDLKQAFTMFDKNGDNKISPVELEEVMKYLGLNPTSDEVKKMIKVVDTNCNGHVDYDEFISMMTQTKLKPRSHDDELREIFQVFDIDGNGFISADEIKTKMAQLGDELSDEEVREMIKSADINGDGQIDINEFSRLLQYAKGLK